LLKPKSVENIELIITCREIDAAYAVIAGACAEEN
jgi:hypothetical protein